jgi:hypothetical protein
VLEQMPDWIKAALMWIVSGGAAAIAAQKGMAHFKSAGLDVKIAELHGGILVQMGEQMQRLDAEHKKMSVALNDANQLLLNVQKRLIHMDIMLSKMHRLLVEHDIDVPHDVQDHLMREII